uniref:Uncharacterized protein n=1 Tax=viral metagenome TaxID=1070528 RepID=A0A6C0LRH2_9ZZZZ
MEFFDDLMASLNNIDEITQMINKFDVITFAMFDQVSVRFPAHKCTDEVMRLLIPKLLTQFKHFGMKCYPDVCQDGAFVIICIKKG